MLNHLDPFVGFTLANAAAHVSIGTLLAPDAFRSECLRTKQRPTFDAWAIYARMPDDVVHLMESPLVPRGAGFTIMASRTGSLYPIAMQQMAGLQLRTMLCLQDDETQEWLRHCAERDTVTLALEVEETAELAVLRSHCGQITRTEANALIARCQRLPRDQYVSDAGALARHLVDPKAVPSAIDGIDVDSVRLILAFGGQRTDDTLAPETQPTPLH